MTISPPWGNLAKQNPPPFLGQTNGAVQPAGWTAVFRAGRLAAQGKISFYTGKSLAITIVYDIIKVVACFPAEQT